MDKTAGRGAFSKTACAGSAPDARRPGVRRTTIRQTVSLASCALTAAVALAACTGPAASEAVATVVSTPVAVDAAVQPHSEAAHAPQPEASEPAAPKPTELPLVNTASVLFPHHTLTIEAIEAQKSAFRSNLVQIPQSTRTVGAVTAVHVGPSEADDVLAVLAPGDEIEVDGQVADWFRIAENPATAVGASGGYVSGLAFVPSDAEDGLAWQASVTNSGDSAAVDACTGGLTEFTAMSRDLGVPAYTIHSYCGGDPILTLHVGDEIAIDGTRYQVETVNDFPLYSSTEVMQGLHSDAYVQTCNLVAGQSRVLGLAKLGG